MSPFAAVGKCLNREAWSRFFSEGELFDARWALRSIVKEASVERNLSPSLFTFAERNGAFEITAQIQNANLTKRFLSRCASAIQIVRLHNPRAENAVPTPPGFAEIVSDDLP